ncbi:PREDICTED: oral-facial-digital syndrome 1 protein homolog [Amphimedon queenslandica]|uniref:Uncharacterized protein n=1 Tax=Amphimedon queenslandica TaxID=400682 RepID=A0A1X7V3E4_AMPQE|nr:PREDICTED: oral-facial-digital syndrome 1 protein homolog [Amphimedon queenslandica]|eukprot:XP_011403326.1 PREDICTED: oral-facial-digital syndrome 1 protein homolog [Amphimedon queenslandica]
MAAVDQDELRAKLYSSLQKKGLLDSLKSQLRNSLISELQPPSGSEPSQKRPSSLHHQIASYIIINYLQSNGYQYTLSTFLPEAGLRMEKLLSFDDVCQVLGLTSQILEPLKACENEQDRKSLLIQLLHRLPSLLKQRRDTVSCGVQTNEREEAKTVTEKKIEEEEEERKVTLEKRMIAFQKSCEARNKKTIEQELSRFREKELSVMRLEERNKYLKELAQAKEQLELKYRERLTSSTRTVEEERERLRRRETDIEQGLYNQRQTLLIEMESLKLRENELTRQSELDRRAASLEKDKSTSLQQLLNEKEEMLNSLKKQYEKMAEARVERLKVELETKFLQEGKKAAEMKAQFETQQSLIDELSTKYESVTAELDHERETAKQLQEELQLSNEKTNSLFIENTQLNERLKLVDSSSLRERLRESEKKLQELRQQTDQERTELKRIISDQEIAVNDAKNKLSKSVKQQKENQRKSQEKFKEMQAELTSLTQANKILKDEIAKKMDAIFKLHDQLTCISVEYRSAQSQIKDLKQHIDGLHDVLTSSGTRNRTKKKHSPRRKLTTRQTSLSTPPTEMMSPAPSIDISLFGAPTNNNNDNDINDFSITPNTNNDISFSDSSAMILAEARATFARMEKESEELARYYSDYSAPPPPSLPHSSLLSYYPPVTTMMSTTNDNLPYLSTQIPSLPTPSVTSSTTPFISNPITSLTTPPLPTPLTTPRTTASLVTLVSSVTTPITTSSTPPTSTVSAPVGIATPPSQKPINLSSHWTPKKPQPTENEKASIIPTTTVNNLLLGGATCVVPSSVDFSFDPMITPTSQNNVTLSLRNGALCTTNTIDNSGRLLLHPVSDNTTNTLTTAHSNNATTSAIGPSHVMVNGTGAGSTISNNCTSTTGTTAAPLCTCTCTCSTITDSKGIYTTACSTSIGTVTVQAGSVSCNSTITRSVATTAVVDNKQYERWSIEREKKLKAQREEEERERIKIQQELLALQQEEERGREGKPEPPQTKIEESKDASKGNPSETDDDDKSEVKWTMAQYMSSVKDHSNSNHYQTRIHQNEDEVLDLLSAPTESDEGSDPFANW